MKISEYERVEKVDEFDLFLLEKMTGTKSVRLDDIYWSMMDSMSVENRRHVWRGKNLGAEFTGQQRASIKDGSFRGLFLGDYWENPEITTDYYGADNPIPIKWRIVDFDYGYGSHSGDGSGQPQCLTHHITIMPDELLQATDSGSPYDANLIAYHNSTIRNVLHNSSGNIHTKIKNMFGLRSNGASRVTLWYHAIESSLDTNGYPNGIIESELTIDLPSYAMIFGPSAAFFDLVSNIPPRHYSAEQLSAFSLNQQKLLVAMDHGFSIGGTFWCQEAFNKNLSNNTQRYFIVNLRGELTIHNGPDPIVGVRPVFCINGED